MSKIITLNLPEKAELVSRAGSMLDMAKAYAIDCPEVYELAADDLKAIKTEQKKLEDDRKKHVAPLNEETKFINGLYKEAATILDSAESTIKTAMLAFQREQSRIAQEAQAKLEAQARAERERLAAQAKEAEKAGDTATAAAVQAMSQVVTAPVVTPATTKVAGISTREVWSAEVTDKLAYIKHVLEARPDLVETILIDMKALNGMAKALKASFSLPGVKAVANETMAARSC